MSELSPSQQAGISAVETAVYAALVGEHREARRVLVEAIAGGLSEEVVTGLLGVTQNALERLGEATGTDPVSAWGEFMRRQR